MPGSISMASRQTNLLSSNFLDLTGDSRADFAPISFDALATTLADIAVQFSLIARKKLEQADRIASGGLADSIVPTAVSIFGTTYKVDINVASFYKFVDQGVKGWQDEKGGNSPYQFKHFIGPSGQKTSKMVDAIKKWLISEGLKGTGRENAHSKASIRDRKRASITDSTTQTAIIISKSIRKKGLKPSHFWTDSTAEVEQLIKQRLGEAFKLDIISNLTNVQ